MATGWQQEILTRLQARDAHDRAYAEIIENCEDVTMTAIAASCSLVVHFLTQASVWPLKLLYSRNAIAPC